MSRSATPSRLTIAVHHALGLELALGKDPMMNPLTRRFRPVSGLHAALLTTSLALGLAFALLPTVAHASCGRDDCGGSTQISAVTVYHTSGVTNTVPVEPDTGETIEVTAYWDALEFAGGGCSCHQTASSSVTVDVDWNESTDTWDYSCTGCSGAGPIYGVTVCHVDGCGTMGAIANAWAYELVVQVAKNNGLCTLGGGSVGYLSHVDYETTAVDDGDTIRTSNCTELAAVSPTSQSFSVTDNGAFECTYSCAVASGPVLYITYE